MSAMPKGPLLGFDYGTRRIGVAVGQGLTGTANPVAVVNARDGKPDWAEIETLVSEWRPIALVVGLPRHADGSDNELTPRVRRFARQLAGRTGLDVHTIDEHLSSVAAERTLQHGSRRGARDELDAMAAACILEDWLAQQHGYREEERGQ